MIYRSAVLILPMRAVHESRSSLVRSAAVWSRVGGVLEAVREFGELSARIVAGCRRP